MRECLDLSIQAVSQEVSIVKPCKLRRQRPTLELKLSGGDYKKVVITVDWANIKLSFTGAAKALQVWIKGCVMPP